jgi:hypothetical protein
VQFDRTRIVIRQRGIWDILDLSLRITRIYARPLLLSGLFLGLPLALLNAWLLHWVVADEYSGETISRYLGLMMLLVFLQTPVATLPTTALLGRVLFLQDLSWRAILADVRQAASGICRTQLLVRGGWLVALLMINLRPSLEAGDTEIWLWLVGVYSLLLRLTRPYINEIVLLERNPVRPRPGRTITIGRRARALHRPNTSDLVSRWWTAAAATAALSASLGMTAWFAVGIVTNQWRWGPLLVELILPGTFWLAAIYTTVVKFINYLDLRIRREGWEVELEVRAVAHEIKRDLELRGQTA